mgnify:CR=1 FL=1|tara:strand:- start:3783 stop:4091 length:309 start_codon:yes stop_codon:yes gene_type:complete
MARFDVYKYDNSSVPFVLDVQANLLSELSTCAVIPMVSEKKAKQEALQKLKPTIAINGQNYILMTTDIGTVTRSSLGKKIANIEDEYRQVVTEALDFLFQGF